MARGSISKLVSTFGSKWGRIRQDGTETDLFFNSEHLIEPTDFDLMQVGQTVEFEAHADQITNGHAERVVIVNSPAPATTPQA